MTMDEGQQQTYTSWELAGDWWWVGRFHARVLNGISLYEDAVPSRDEQSVVFRRLEGLHQINRRLSWEQQMELIPIPK